MLDEVMDASPTMDKIALLEMGIKGEGVDEWMAETMAEIPREMMDGIGLRAARIEIGFTDSLAAMDRYRQRNR